MLAIFETDTLAGSAAGAEPLFDRAALEDLVDGDQDLLQQLVNLFLADLPRLLDAVWTAIALRDAGALRLAAHSLRGTMSHFRAAACAEAAVLEEMGRTGDLAAAVEVFARLNEAVARFAAALLDLSVPSYA